MPIHIECADCGADYDVSDELRGKKVRCRSCGEAILVKGTSGIKRKEPEPRKSAASSRHDEEDDDRPRRKTAPSSRRRDEDDDDRPRKRKAPIEEESSNKTLLLAGGLVGGLVLVGAIAVLVFAIRKEKEVAAAPTQKQSKPAAFVPPSQPPPQQQAPPQRPFQPAPTEDPKAKSPAPDPAGPPDVSTAGRPSSEKVYERVCKSTVLILVAKRSGNQLVLAGQGSGTLIDKTNRLVLTNDHVAGSAADIAVFFQAFDKGRRIGEINYFMEQLEKSKAEVIHGKLVYTDKRVDLALVQLDRLPPDAQALPIADKSPAVTNSVLSVGHPKGIGGGGLWVHTSGEIRQFQARRKWRAGDETGVTDHQADVILTNSQTNPGDSGGPLVNMRAQLVGVTQGGVRDANALSIFIDLPEVRKLLKDYEAKSRVKLALEIQSGVGGDTTSLPKLLADLGNRDAQVRTQAALALGEMGPDAQRAIPELFKALKDREESVARGALQALRAIGTPTKDDVPMLIEGLRDANLRVRGYAVEALGKLGPEARSAVPKLAELLKAKETDAEMRQQAAKCLGQIGPAAATQGVPVLSEALKDPDAALREAAADALGKLGVQARTTVPSLLALLEDKETTVRRAALSALAQIGPEAKEVLPKLKPALKDADVEIRRGALAVLGRLGIDAVKDKEALAALKVALDDKDLCKNVLTALARIGPPAKELARGLGKYLQDESTRLEAVAALGAVLEKVKLSRVEEKAYKPVLDELISLFEVQDNNLRTKAVEALGKIGSAAVTPLVQAMQKAAPLRNDLPATRLGIARALAAIGSAAKRQDVIIILTQLSRTDPSPQIRDACDKALQRIQ
jgi:predicted Zn finger-like uncharacterized protein